MYSSFNPRLGPFYSFIMTKSPFQAVHQLAHQNPIFTRWKPSVTEVQCSLCFVIYNNGFVNEMHAELRQLPAKHGNNRNTSTSGKNSQIDQKKPKRQTNKKKKTKKSKFIGWFFFLPLSPISSQWIGHMMIHAVHRWGTFSQKMTEDIRSTTTRTPEQKQILRFLHHPKDSRIIAKIRNPWKDTFSWSLTSQMWYVCRPNVLFVHSHEERCVSVSLTYGDGLVFFCFVFILSVNVKIHLQPEYWDKQFTVTNLHTRIDSYL